MKVMNEEQTEITKKCTKCGRELPLSCFHKDKTFKYGVAYQCKECKNKKAKEVRLSKGIKPKNCAESIEVDGVIYKECSKCKELLPLSCFGKEKTGKYGVKAKCKECSNKDNKQWRLDNKEMVSEYKKQWNLDNKEYKKQYSLDNPEYIKQYRLDHPEKFANYRHRRRQREKTASIGDQIKCEEINAECRRMNAEAGYEAYHVDHIFPLIREDSSGLNCWWNLQILPAEENRRKHNKLLKEDYEAWRNELLTKFG